MITEKQSLINEIIKTFELKFETHHSFLTTWTDWEHKIFLDGYHKKIIAIVDHAIDKVREHDK